MKSSLAEAKSYSREEGSTHCQGHVQTGHQESWRTVMVHRALRGSQEGPGDQATMSQETVRV